MKVKENSAKPEQPQRRRKNKCGPFERSYEEEPEPIREIEWCPGQLPFTTDPLAYFALGDTNMVPSIRLSRALRKGDILEVFVMDISNPGSFFIRIMGPKNFLRSEDGHHPNAWHLSKFTADADIESSKLSMSEQTFLDSMKNLTKKRSSSSTKI